MSAPLIVVTGTGTGIGKTHISCALLRRASADGRVFGYKPIESGLDDSGESDSARLASASTFHVQHSPGLRLRAGLSPHLAAELEAAKLDWPQIVRFVDEVRADGVGVLVELPGGLYTPLAERFRNIDAILAIAPDVTLLVAANRLGVLHDVGAALAAASSAGVTVSCVGLSEPSTPDVSTASNARELARFEKPVVVTWPRRTVDTLAKSPATERVVQLWLSRPLSI